MVMAASAQTTSTFDLLDGHSYMSLQTFRKSGVGVPTPVWFAKDGDTLYVVTQETSGKVKRIRNNGQVEIAPCDVRGGLLGVDYVPAQARIITDAAEIKQADKALSKKYSWQLAIFRFLARFRKGNWAHLAITPQA